MLDGGLVLKFLEALVAGLKLVLESSWIRSTIWSYFDLRMIGDASMYVGDGSNRDTGGKLFRGDYVGVELEVGDEVSDRTTSKYVKHNVDMEVD